MKDVVPILQMKKLRLGKVQYHHTTEALRKLRLKAGKRLSPSHIESIVDRVKT